MTITRLSLWLEAMDVEDLGMLPALFGEGRWRSGFEKESAGFVGRELCGKLLSGLMVKMPWCIVQEHSQRYQPKL